MAISKDFLWETIAALTTELERADPQSILAARTRGLLYAKGFGLHTTDRHISRRYGVKRGQPTGVEDIARAEAMKERYLGGETLRQIAESYGISHERVRQILRKFGVESLGRRPEHNAQPHELTQAELEAVDLYKRGTRPKVILGRTGLTVGQLHAALRRCNVERRGKGHWLKRPDDAEITAKVCDLYQRGFTAPQIVKRVPQLKWPETVYRYLKRGGVPPREPWKGRHLKPEQREAA